MALAPRSEPPLVFFPQSNRRVLSAYNLWDGEKVHELVGHYDTPVCAVYNPVHEVQSVLVSALDACARG